MLTELRWTWSRQPDSSSEAVLPLSAGVPEKRGKLRSRCVCECRERRFGAAGVTQPSEPERGGGGRQFGASFDGRPRCAAAASGRYSNRKTPRFKTRLAQQFAPPGWMLGRGVGTKSPRGDVLTTNDPYRTVGQLLDVTAPRWGAPNGNLAASTGRHDRARHPIHQLGARPPATRRRPARIHVQRGDAYDNAVA